MAEATSGNEDFVADSQVHYPEAVGGREPAENSGSDSSDVYRRMMSGELVESVMLQNNFSYVQKIDCSGIKFLQADVAYGDIMETIMKEYPQEEALQRKRVLKMFKTLLGAQCQGTVELAEVTIENFLQFIRFFGPFRTEENRCVVIKQLEQLVENSSHQLKAKRSKICWFAGYMTRQEAEQKLRDQKPGTFLIRMSMTEDFDGRFVLSAVMQDAAIDHFQIKGHPEEAVATHPYSQELEFKGRRFTSLPDLVNNFLRLETIVSDPEEPENGVRCSTICPGLPYNHILDGYKFAK